MLHAVSYTGLLQTLAKVVEQWSWSFVSYLVSRIMWQFWALLLLLSSSSASSTSAASPFSSSLSTASMLLVEFVVVLVGIVVVVVEGLGVVVVVVPDRPKKNALVEAMTTSSTRNFILDCLVVF